MATELGLSLGNIPVNDSDPLRSAGVESKTVGRKACWIILGAKERWFIFSGWSMGVQLISGSTSDLREMAQAMAAWRNGLKVREIQAAAPFVKVSELAEAHEQGPAVAVALKWHLLLARLRQGFEKYDYARSVHEVVEAAYGEPKLRQLYPFTSHWSLHFTTCTGFPYSRDVPFIAPLSDGRYRICGPTRGTVIGETDTAKQAISMVVNGVPEHCGPATAGTADDQQRSSSP